MSAILLLEDGTSFEGISLGTSGQRVGEIVLHTAVVGYQEMMTDPCNAGKILVFTYPLIGNYGIAERFNESKRCWIAGLVIKEQSRIYSNWQAEDSLPRFLEKQEVVAIGEIDTRTLAIKIRDRGQMWGILSTEEVPKAQLLQMIRDQKDRAKNDFIPQISVDRILESEENESGPRLAILDLGMTHGFLEQFKRLGCHIILLPHGTDAEEILQRHPDGLLVSNGPEEDEAIPQIVETTRKLLGRVPMLGISTGHQIICLALGGSRKKMKVGHHGANYPVISPSAFKGDITFQNHSWAVDEESLAGRGDIVVSLRNLNDQSIEEIESPSLGILSTQYYPISPGFDEVNPALVRFLAMMKAR